MVHKLQIGQVNKRVSRLRCITAQVVACACPNLLLLGLGMAVSFVTIAVPELLNASEGLSLNDFEASWFGGLAFLTQPVGAIISGPIVDYFGRKKANVLVNIPYVISWILMYFAWNVPSLFIANSLLGLGTGIMEAPINSYVGEISEPSLRGALIIVNQIFLALGILAIYFIGMFVTWRVAALISLVGPLLSMLLVVVVPETPIWLLSRGRDKDALKSLQYLRGWTSEEEVQEEYNQLVIFTKDLQKCVICLAHNEKPTEDCIHRHMHFFKRNLLKFRYVMLVKETVWPLIFIVLYFFFYNVSGLVPVKPNMGNVCGAFGMRDSGKNIVVIVGVIAFLTSIFLVWIIKAIGKRKLALSAMVLSGASATALSVYAKHYLDDKVFSYDTSTFPKETSYTPLALFYIMTIFNGVPLPWVVLGEMFPFRSRASAQGIAAASNYAMMFLASKTLIDLEISVHLWGAFAVYAGFAFVGTIYLYLYLPETEGKTLQEVQNLYDGKHRIFADDPFINFFRKFKR